MTASSPHFGPHSSRPIHPVDRIDIAKARHWAAEVLSMVAALPNPQARVLHLAYGEGLSAAELADRLGIAQAEANSLLARAMIKLGALLSAGSA